MSSRQTTAEQESYFQQVCSCDSEGWGVWTVSFPHNMTGENALKNLDRILPELKKRWQEWREAQLGS